MILEKILGNLLGSENLARSGRNFIKVEAQINSLDAEVNEHKAETMTYRISVTRDASITGIQTINLVAGRMPKFITLQAVVIDSNKVSINSGGFTVYQIENTKTWRNSTADIVIANTYTDRILGNVQNIKNGSFEINWTNMGASVTGVINIFVGVLYHD